MPACLDEPGASLTIKQLARESELSQKLKTLELAMQSLAALQGAENKEQQRLVLIVGGKLRLFQG